MKAAWALKRFYPDVWSLTPAKIAFLAAMRRRDERDERLRMADAMRAARYQKPEDFQRWIEDVNADA